LDKFLKTEPGRGTRPARTPPEGGGPCVKELLVTYLVSRWRKTLKDLG